MIIETNKDKGRAGLVLAIAYFGANGYTVSVPLNDTQDYDLIVDKDNVLSKVSVKFTARKPKTSYEIQLRSTGGSGQMYYGTFIDSKADYLFAVTEEKKMYFIPKNEIKCSTSFSLTKDYDSFLVEI